jgi:hypothetical protein
MEVVPGGQRALHDGGGSEGLKVSPGSLRGAVTTRRS